MENVKASLQSGSVGEAGVERNIDLLSRAMQCWGRLENGSVSGTLYSQQTENSMTALADLLRSFECFISDATEMDMSNLREFYGSK